MTTNIIKYIIVYNEGGEKMKSDKILRMIQKLQVLDEDTVGKIDSTVDACVIVQTLKNITANKKIEQVL